MPHKITWLRIYEVTDLQRVCELHYIDYAKIAFYNVEKSKVDQFGDVFYLSL